MDVNSLNNIYSLTIAAMSSKETSEIARISDQLIALIDAKMQDICSASLDARTKVLRSLDSLIATIVLLPNQENIVIKIHKLNQSIRNDGEVKIIEKPAQESSLGAKKMVENATPKLAENDVAAREAFRVDLEELSSLCIAAHENFPRTLRRSLRNCKKIT